MKRIFIVLILFLSMSTCWADIHSWIDENGVKHFTDSATVSSTEKKNNLKSVISERKTRGTLNPQDCLTLREAQSQCIARILQANPTVKMASASYEYDVMSVQFSGYYGETPGKITIFTDFRPNPNCIGEKTKFGDPLKCYTYDAYHVFFIPGSGAINDMISLNLFLKSPFVKSSDSLRKSGL